MTVAPTRPLLRVATAGSVDDGKSTLIGRLLHDTGSIPPDQLEQIREASERRGTERGTIDLALLTDGLRAEREQGITIDVAYRYFRLAGRDVILADTPGHEQYTRNMITGASTADVGLVLVDARAGLTEQSKRHAALCGLLRVPVIWCVNKLDLLAYDEVRFNIVAAEIEHLSDATGLDVLAVLPVSALLGDNIVERSLNTSWHSGPTLFEALDAVSSLGDPPDAPFRLPIQWVIRPQTDEHPDYRAYAGQIASGSVKVGDRLVSLPSGHESTVIGVDLMG
ncbi:MAG: GTP-binding protein, partial [Solirubrobacterales bacterium]|nr:GTP-binding protein [Solirubrobacterales bacterium]